MLPCGPPPSADLHADPIGSASEQAIRPGVGVDRPGPGETAEGQAALGRKLDRERARSADTDEDRAAGDGGLLHELEREAAGHAHDAAVERNHALAEGPTDDLVHRVVPAHVLPGDDRSPVRVEQTGRMEAAGALEP